VRVIRRGLLRPNLSSPESTTYTMSENFQTYSRYYDLLSQDKDYAGEVEYVHRTIQENNPGARRLLEFGSGTGGHARLLVERGYEVVGIEKSPEMARLANSKIDNEHFRSVVGDIAGIRLNESFDAVVALFHVISYQTSNDQLMSVFRNAQLHLCEGGIFLFDAWYTPAVLKQKPQVRVKRVEDERIKVIRIAEPEDHSHENVVDVKYHLLIRDRKSGEVEEFHEVHPMRHFSIPEISLLASLTGFILLRAEEWMSASPPTQDTWGVCFILRKA